MGVYDVLPQQRGVHSASDTTSSEAARSLPAVSLRAVSEPGNASGQVDEIKSETELSSDALSFSPGRPARDIEARQSPFQLKQEKTLPNNTGLPDQLKSNIENLSGFSLNSVKVHYNSDKPAQLQALAYASGTDIHVAPGQERHLAHEAWHIVQQAQGRVKPTVQLKAGVKVNDDPFLEQEADKMGSEAQNHSPSQPFQLKRELKPTAPDASVAQRLLLPFKTPAVPDADEINIANDATAIEQLTVAAYTNTWNRLNEATRLVNPVALDIAMFPGVTAGHFSFLVDQMGGTNNALKAAAAGYVIEDQVTHGGNVPATVQAQVGAGTAIPDFVSYRNNKRGIIDVTSSGETGHVMEKNFNKSSFEYIAESVYLSINFAGLNGGAAPLLTGNAAQIVQAAKQRRANSHIGSLLYQLNRTIELMASGIMWGNKGYYDAMVNLRTAVNGLSNGLWSQMEIDNIDELVDQLNAFLHPDFHQRSLTGMVADTRAKYVLAGGPMWP